MLVKPPTPPATHPHYFSLVRPHFPQVRVFKGHGHWVNTLALSTEHALRTGAYDHTGSAPSDPEEAQAQALQRCELGEERGKCGAYDHTGSAPSDPEEAQAQALQRCDFGGG